MWPGSQPLLLLLVSCFTARRDPEPYSDCRTDEGHDFSYGGLDSGGQVLWVEGDTLHVVVGYGGGCEEHTFQICWPDAIFLESYPVQVNLELWHGGKEDNCDAYLSEELSFDLGPLKQSYQDAYRTETGEIEIHLGPESVLYSF